MAIDYTNLINKIPKKQLIIEDVSIDEGRSVKTPEAFVYSFLLYWNNLYDTLLITENGDTALQTKKAKNRSLGDIYNITRTYFPKVKLKTVVDTLYAGIINNIGISSLFCGDILKQVFYSGYYISSHLSSIESVLPETNYNYDYYDEELDEYVESVYTDEEQWIVDHYEKYGEADEYGILLDDYKCNIDYDKTNKNVYNENTYTELMDILYNICIKYINNYAMNDQIEKSRLKFVINNITDAKYYKNKTKNNYLLGLINK